MKKSTDIAAADNDYRNCNAGIESRQVALKFAGKRSMAKKAMSLIDLRKKSLSRSGMKHAMKVLRISKSCAMSLTKST